MPRTTEGRLLDKVAELVRGAQSRPRRSRRTKSETPPASIAWHLRDPKVSVALTAISDTLAPRHGDPVREDIASGRLRPLTHFVAYMAFLESVSPPVRPLALHPELADWLLELPAGQLRYYPADPCWQCGYRYPGSGTGFSLRASGISTSPRLPLSALPSLPLAPSLADPHPWAGRKCLYCGGEIVNHLEWLGPSPTRTLADFQKAPYRTKQQPASNPPGTTAPALSDGLSPAELELLESMNLLP